MKKAESEQMILTGSDRAAADTPHPEHHRLSEETVDQLWIFRQTFEAEEYRARKARHDVEEELFSRFEAGATLLPTSFGAIKKVLSKTWAYTQEGVKGLGEFLLRAGMVSEAEWKRVVRWEPRLDGHFVRKIKKFGPLAEQKLDDARMGATGRPQLDGPSLSEMGYGETHDDKPD